MHGENMIRMNHETVCEAIQEYLDKRTVTPIGKVTNFAESSNSHGAKFDVTIVAEPKPATARV